MNSINRDRLYSAKNAHYELGKLLYDFEELAQSHWDLEQALKLADQQLSEAREATKELGKDLRDALHDACRPGSVPKKWVISSLAHLEKLVRQLEEALGIREQAKFAKQVCCSTSKLPDPPEDEFALAK